MSVRNERIYHNNRVCEKIVECDDIDDIDDTDDTDDTDCVDDLCVSSVSGGSSCTNSYMMADSDVNVVRLSTWGVRR